MHKISTIFFALCVWGSAWAQKQGEFERTFFKAQAELAQEHWEEAEAFFVECTKLQPKEAVIWFELSKISWRNRQFIPAVERAEEAVDLDPSNAWYVKHLASLYHVLGKREEELKARIKAAELEPKNTETLYELAVVQLNLYRYNDALETINQIQSTTGINEVIAQQKKQIYLAINNLPKALETMHELAVAYPGVAEYRLELARLYGANNILDQATEVLQEALRDFPSEPNVLLDLAQLSQDAGDFNQAFTYLQEAFASPALDVDKKIAVLLGYYSRSEQSEEAKVEAYKLLDIACQVHPTDAKIFAMLGDYFARDERLIEAITAYRTAVNAPGGAPYEVWRQLVLIEAQLKQYDSLLVDAQRVVDRFPNQPMPYYLGAIALMEVKEYEQAAELLEQGLPFTLRDVRLKEQFYQALGESYYRLGQNDQMDQAFKKALNLQPNNPGTLNNYAFFLAEQGRKLEEAKRMAERATKMAPKNPVYLDTYGWVLFKLGDHQEALTVFRECMQNGGNTMAEVVEHYGDVLSEVGQGPEAVEQWRKSLELGGNAAALNAKINAQNNP